MMDIVISYALANWNFSSFQEINKITFENLSEILSSIYFTKRQVFIPDPKLSENILAEKLSKKEKLLKDQNNYSIALQNYKNFQQRYADIFAKGEKLESGDFDLLCCFTNETPYNRHFRRYKHIYDKHKELYHFLNKYRSSSPENIGKSLENINSSYEAKLEYLTNIQKEEFEKFKRNKISEYRIKMSMYKSFKYLIKDLKISIESSIYDLSFKFNYIDDPLSHFESKKQTLINKNIEILRDTKCI